MLRRLVKKLTIRPLWAYYSVFFVFHGKSDTWFMRLIFERKEVTGAAKGGT